ncbi:hypothetical protein VIGAN_08188000 [Vigna angularis var. angularis]|uniref:Uncharacterized protein n=1 Tax=Vigna angularis var. angularis TaxID=157739 RepID=A0A0S3SQU7_PHAAN|nr:hypothetical protein VIGAN_08188000 [Vigna angularis var. angularis]
MPSPTVGDARRTVEDVRPTVEDVRPTVKDARPTVEDARSTVENARSPGSLVRPEDARSARTLVRQDARSARALVQPEDARSAGRSFVQDARQPGRSTAREEDARILWTNVQKFAYLDERSANNRTFKNWLSHFGTNVQFETKLDERFCRISAELEISRNIEFNPFIPDFTQICIIQSIYNQSNKVSSSPYLEK